MQRSVDHGDPNINENNCNTTPASKAQGTSQKRAKKTARTRKLRSLLGGCVAWKWQWSYSRTLNNSSVCINKTWTMVITTDFTERGELKGPHRQPMTVERKKIQPSQGWDHPDVLIWLFTGLLCTVPEVWLGWNSSLSLWPICKFTP